MTFRLACFIGITATACAPLAAQAPGALNVRDFGAVGDGQADDTAAFQSTLDQCAAAGGGIVYAPTGRYRIATHLTIPRAVTLEGVFTAPPTVNAYHDPADPAAAPLLIDFITAGIDAVLCPNTPTPPNPEKETTP